ncbi:hypothetical protein Q664_28620 [Archangium violaceum Cb vi76]|uniref:Uncharacterized protein n=1 Tax=Archangium violaceum Cb vi76 TaxID=1406225 RepID=A0A084SPM5_9BACT|nr:hypothetical protein Q664_28620 [Archangium violaceum Cb vi76]
MYVHSVERASRQHRFSRECSLPLPVLSIAMPEETFRDFAVPDGGGVLYSVRTLEGVTLRRYTCRRAAVRSEPGTDFQNFTTTDSALRFAGPWNTTSTLFPSGSSRKAA